MTVVIERLDHFVLTVRDLDVTCAFYEKVLGMTAITFGEGRRALRFGDQKINLHALGREHEPKAQTPQSGSGDVCFITATPLDDVERHLRACGIELLEGGQTPRTGAIGAIMSLYFHDPDGNLIEVSRYL